MNRQLLSRLKILSERNESLILIAILAIGLLIRLALIFTITEPIDRDAKEYYDIAQNLVAGNGFSIDGGTPTARRSPGYPFFLAGIIAIFGRNPRIIYIVQALINILTILLTYLALRYAKVSSPLRLLVVLLFSLSTSFVFVNVLYAEILTMFFVGLLLLISLHPTLQFQQPLQSVIIGILIGCLIYLRPTFLYLPFFILITILLVKTFQRQFIIRNYLMTVVITLLMVTPWTIRNYIKFDQFIPLVSAGGGELWGANFEIADRVVWHSVTDIQKYENERTHSHNRQNQLISEYRLKYNLDNPEKLNQFLSRQGKTIILHHPFRYALLSVNRLLIFWFSPPIGSATIKSISPIIFLIVILVKYSLTILGLFGLWQFARHNLSAVLVILSTVVYLTLLHAATHAIQRYFLPLMPVMYFAMGYFLNTRTLIPSKGYKDN